MPRDDGVQGGAGKRDGGVGERFEFRERVAGDAAITKYLDAKGLAHAFDLQRQLRYVDAIFARVFAEKATEKSVAGSAGKK